MFTANHNQSRTWVHIALLNLFVVALAGLFLRMLLIFPVPHSNFQNFLHAHSHFAFSGWGFMALYIAFYDAFIPVQAKGYKSYKQILILGLVAAYGMLFSFPFHGYAFVSISFSTLFIFVSYWFGWRFYRDAKSKEAHPVSLRFASAAIFFLIISSIGPFAMGPIMAAGGSGSPLYYNAIYFYLHFQYNGWFIFGIVALFFKWMEQRNIRYESRQALWFYRLMLGSLVLTFMLSILWNKPNDIFYYIAGAGGILQVAAILPLWRSIYQDKKSLIKEIHPINRTIGAFIAFLFFIKLILQFFSAFPLVVRWTVTTKPLVIGYLHLVLLGIFTLFLFAFFIQKGLLVINRITNYGLILFLAGILLTEILLFTQSLMNISGSFIPQFNQWIFTLTILLPAGAGTLFFGNLSVKYLNAHKFSVVGEK